MLCIKVRLLGVVNEVDKARKSHGWNRQCGAFAPPLGADYRRTWRRDDAFGLTACGTTGTSTNGSNGFPEAKQDTTSTISVWADADRQAAVKAQICVRITDLIGQEVASADGATGAKDDWTIRAEAAVELLDKALSNGGRDRSGLLGVGIGLPGQITRWTALCTALSRISPGTASTPGRKWAADSGFPSSLTTTFGSRPSPKQNGASDRASRTSSTSACPVASLQVFSSTVSSTGGPGGRTVEQVYPVGLPEWKIRPEEGVPVLDVPACPAARIFRVR